MIFFNHEFLFIHNPKTAGTALLSYFYRVFSGPFHTAGVNELGTFHPHMSLALGFACAKTGNRPQDFKQILSVIRNPYGREVSMYTYFRDVLSLAPDHSDNLNDSRIVEAVKQASVLQFSDYIAWVCQTFGTCDIWNSRYYYALESGGYPDNLTILRMEDLDEKLPIFLSQLPSAVDGVSGLEKLARVNETNHLQPETYFDSGAESAVFESYRWVFELGEYNRIGATADPVVSLNLPTGGVEGYSEEATRQESGADLAATDVEEENQSVLDGEQLTQSFQIERANLMHSLESTSAYARTLEAKVSALARENEALIAERQLWQSLTATKQTIIDARDAVVSQTTILNAKIADLGQLIRSASRGGESTQTIRVMYLDLLESALTGVLYEDPSMSPHVERGFNLTRRTMGQDWPVHAQTMIGTSRLRNLRTLIMAVLNDGIPGDFLEAGVWRGGACIYMRGILSAYDVRDRIVWVADSFHGLPPPDPQYAKDAGDIHHQIRELAVSLEEVKKNFSRYELLDDQVRFLPGWFKDTLPSAPVNQLAILRMDGDMYSSTIETLEALYHRVVPGGFIIVDDYTLPGAHAAVHDFRDRENISEPIEMIDGSATFWRKAF